MAIKILDCTLRDGGYINNWNFGYDCIKEVFKNLSRAKINYIECGFLRDCVYLKENSLYNNISDINNIISGDTNASKIALMILYNSFNFEKIIKKNSSINLDTIRIALKKHEIKEGFEKIKKIIDYGYEIFINPTNIDNYSTDELLEIIKKVNDIKPYAFSIVDTKGVLRENNIINIYNIIEENLDEKISLCFHSHNNLQLSFSNAQTLLKLSKNRELIIDSSIFGMGRGAGNISSELLAKYINDYYQGNYDIVPILKAIDEYINPIFLKTPWGYSVPYYLAAINGCHPNYAKYMIDKKTVPIETIDEILKTIPDDKKPFFDIDLIDKIYSEKMLLKV